MLSSLKNFLAAELADASVQRGVIAALSMIAIKHGLDQEHADTFSTALWSAITILVSRMPGKSQP